MQGHLWGMEECGVANGTGWLRRVGHVTRIKSAVEAEHSSTCSEVGVTTSLVVYKGFTAMTAIPGSLLRAAVLGQLSMALNLAGRRP